MRVLSLGRERPFGYEGYSMSLSPRFLHRALPPALPQLAKSWAFADSRSCAFRGRAKYFHMVLLLAELNSPPTRYTLLRHWCNQLGRVGIGRMTKSA